MQMYYVLGLWYKVDMNTLVSSFLKSFERQTLPDQAILSLGLSGSEKR